MSGPKSLIIIDAATEIPAAAFRMDEVGDGILAAAIVGRAGYGKREDQHGYVALVHLVGPVIETDPYAWPNLTMTVAHRWLIEHYDEHPDGGALDVEQMRLEMVAGLA